MRRLQIYIPEELYQELRQQAYSQNTSIAEVIRKKVSKKTIATRKIPTNPGKAHAQAMLKLAKLAEKEGWKGPSDLSSNLDHYLYGDGWIE